MKPIAQEVWTGRRSGGTGHLMEADQPDLSMLLVTSLVNYIKDQQLNT